MVLQEKRPNPGTDALSSAPVASRAKANNKAVKRCGDRNEPQHKGDDSKHKQHAPPHVGWTRELRVQQRTGERYEANNAEQENGFDRQVLQRRKGPAVPVTHKTNDSQRGQHHQTMHDNLSHARKHTKQQRHVDSNVQAQGKMRRAHIEYGYGASSPARDMKSVAAAPPSAAAFCPIMSRAALT